MAQRGRAILPTGDAINLRRWCTILAIVFSLSLVASGPSGSRCPPPLPLQETTSIDPGMVVLSPFTGDPGIAVYIPFPGDPKIVVPPAPPDVKCP